MHSHWLPYIFIQTYLSCHDGDITMESDDDSGIILILILLDLSAAFNTICHATLLSRFSAISLSHSPLNWFKSHFSGRTQVIQVKSFTFLSSSVNLGVPQGSVPGPLFFIIYLIPLINMFHKYNVNFHYFADVTKIYFSRKLPPDKFP